jgi:hypothetical protein
MPLEKGTPAPYAGQLLTPDLAIELGVRASQCVARTQAEVDHAKALAGVQLGLCKQTAEVDAALHRDQLGLLHQELDAARAWYRSPEFVAAVAIVLTTAVLLTARELVVQP